MDLLQEQDHQDIFGEPVDPAEVPDYLGKCSALVFQGPVVLMRVPYPRRSRIVAGPTLNFDDWKTENSIVILFPNWYL